MSSIPIPPSIVTFRDAVGLAMQLADEFAFVNAAALLDSGGTVLDLAIAEGIGRTIDPVVRWAAATVPAPQTAGTDHGCRVVLVSVQPYDVDLIRESDLRLYRRAGWSMAAVGHRLVDWIETDGEDFRSYAYVTCPATAWGEDPPGHRNQDATSL